MFLNTDIEDQEFIAALESAFVLGGTDAVQALIDAGRPPGSSVYHLVRTDPFKGGLG